MVNHSEIYAALVNLFDEDAELTAMLKTKTVIGPELSAFNLWPLLQVVIMTDNMETSMQVSDIFFRINAHTQSDIKGKFDTVTSENILQRVNVLIHDQPLTIDGSSVVYVMYVEGRDPFAIANIDAKGIYLEGLSCRIAAA